ncbi:MAG: DUF4350 domain-containing protein [bacterium]
MSVIKKNEIKFIAVLGPTILIVLVILLLTPESINWMPSFSKKHKIPYGNYILYSLLPDVFPGQALSTASRPLYNVFSEDSLHHTNYLIINTLFNPDNLDSRELFKFVGSGNCAFIAAQTFRGQFADSLGIQTNIDVILNDSLNINFVNPALRAHENYTYRKNTVGFYFSRFDSLQATVLGVSNKNNVNFIRLPFDQGVFFLSTIPFAFTNYNMLFRNNSDYVFKALSYLPLQDIIWDEYYKEANRLGGSALRFILSTEPLKWAYGVAIAGMIVFVCFGAKRRQRIIPVLKPLPNTTLEFVETVGRLYYQNGDHKNLAEKKITYFLESVRNRFHLKTSRFPEPLLESVAEKSGIAKNELKKLFDQITAIQAQDTISQEQLNNLHEDIEDFYKNHM